MMKRSDPHIPKPEHLGEEDPEDAAIGGALDDENTGQIDDGTEEGAHAPDTDSPDRT